MATLNKLKEVVESYQNTLETEKVRVAAVPPATESTTKKRTRRVEMTTTRYEGGNWISAKAKADELVAAGASNVSVQEKDVAQYITRGTIVTDPAWSVWS